MYNFLFGPVPSRRLGYSLGVDLIPFKVCTFDCIYCECGATRRLTTKRKEYIPVEKVKSELSDYFSRNGDPDFVTFSGSGEPTLNNQIADAIEFVHTLRPQLPVAVITNGSLLHLEEVRKQLLKATHVLPSLDAADETIFRQINRPSKNLKLSQYIDGLIQFRQDFPGTIWLEVFMIPGMNTGRKHLLELRNVLQKIRPDRIQLNTLDRPGTVKNIEPASSALLEQIKGDLELENIEIISKAYLKKNQITDLTEIYNTILEVLIRRPCTLEDLESVLGLRRTEITKYLRNLEGKGKVVQQSADRGTFYQISHSP